MNEDFFFHVVTKSDLPSTARRKAYLVIDDWNDWFEFSTLYTLYLYDQDGDRSKLGGVKIGQFDMVDKQPRPDIPNAFDQLGDAFFSLGQDDTYYDRINKRGPALRSRILSGLNDLAHDLPLFNRARSERVTALSLLRSVEPATVSGQFARLAHGGARLTPYRFSYQPKPYEDNSAKPPSLDFDVEPQSLPPSNIHVLIGRNGVGKTTILTHMVEALLKQGNSVDGYGFRWAPDDSADFGQFSNVVSVTFSAFDTFVPPLVGPEEPPVDWDTANRIGYRYIGLRREPGKAENSELDTRQGSKEDFTALELKSLQELQEDFTEAAKVCRVGAKSARWRRALRTLETDPFFRDVTISNLASESDTGDEAASLFERLSSGHKIVLLTTTQLVVAVEEKTVVLIDEPEAHLHPPLLSAFVRALSELLIDRNGVAIVATHSPVVIQEVPSSCVWKLRRTGSTLVADRPEAETFGENVGQLTREVFGLEVTDSGFHTMLREVAEESNSYEEAVRRFDGQLGGEARSILRAMLIESDSAS